MLLAPAPPDFAAYAVKPERGTHGASGPASTPDAGPDRVPMIRIGGPLSARASRAPFANTTPDPASRDADFVRRTLAGFARSALAPDASPLAQFCLPVPSAPPPARAAFARSAPRDATSIEPPPVGDQLTAPTTAARARQPIRTFKCPHCAATLSAGASMCVWCGRDPSIP